LYQFEKIQMYLTVFINCKTRKMKKAILILAIVGLSTVEAHAQSKPRMSIAANIGVPTTSGYSFAYGADLQADFGVASTTFITLSGGY
jgi:hypothetical protein